MRQVEKRMMRMMGRQEIAMPYRDLYHLHHQQQEVHHLHLPEGPL